MLSGPAMKPGDVLRIKNSALRTENTQNHSQITMAEAMVYASHVYPPEMVFALGTLSSEYSTAYVTYTWCPQTKPLPQS